jgi:hypothetical protein
VQNTLRNGLSAPSTGGRTVFYDPENHISVIQAADGTIINRLVRESMVTGQGEAIRRSRM